MAVTENLEAPQLPSPQIPTQPPPQEPVDAGHGGGLAAIAWLLILLIEPIAWGFALMIGLWLSFTEEPVSAWWAWLGLLLFVVAPTAALPLALQSARWGVGAGKVALAVSALLLIATLAYLAYVGLSVVWIIAWVLLTGMLLWGVWLFGKKPPRQETVVSQV